VLALRIDEAYELIMAVASGVLDDIPMIADRPQTRQRSRPPGR
jgi:hypothetical protein